MKCKIKIEDKEYIGDITRRMDVGTYEVWVDELQQNYYISLFQTQVCFPVVGFGCAEVVSIFIKIYKTKEAFYHILSCFKPLS